ncbi:MAG: DUF1223 domain-containing protein [Planctomycetes bacterium]|nr:DUF1223 domain-containing protein [Planctomycetota bacterium]
MSHTPIITLLIAILAFVSACAPTVAADPEGVAVVELFTSEGCSSCPPADALLAKIIDDASKSAQHVYCLSMHVDYWNHLGWADPYSDPAFSRRQRAYGHQMNLPNIYTPQMIVNGTEQFVGSDRAHADRAIAAALAVKAPVNITLNAATDGDGKTIHVSYKVASAPEGAVLHIAYVQTHVQSNPDRGENGGRKLVHANVTRDFKTMPLADHLEDNLTLTRPEITHGSIIAYVQSPDLGPIIGAAAVQLPAAN